MAHLGSGGACMRRLLGRFTHLLLWIDEQLAGPPPRPCEYRRPARITCYRHGERKHARAR